MRRRSFAVLATAVVLIATAVTAGATASASDGSRLTDTSEVKASPPEVQPTEREQLVASELKTLGTVDQVRTENGVTSAIVQTETEELVLAYVPFGPGHIYMDTPKDMPSVAPTEKTESRIFVPGPEGITEQRVESSSIQFSTKAPTQDMPSAAAIPSSAASDAGSISTAVYRKGAGHLTEAQVTPPGTYSCVMTFSAAITGFGYVGVPVQMICNWFAVWQADDTLYKNTGCGICWAVTSIDFWSQWPNPTWTAANVMNVTPCANGNSTVYANVPGIGTVIFLGVPTPVYASGNPVVSMPLPCQT